MSNGWNGALPYGMSNANDLRDAFGTPQFGADGAGWSFLLNGFLVQGGKTTDIPASSTVAIAFNTAFQKQVLGVFVQPLELSGQVFAVAPGYDLEGFNLINGPVDKPYFWWAIGV